MTIKPKTIRLLVVDDHPVFRAGVVAMFQDLTDIKVVAQAEDGVAAVAAYRKHQPDVVLMDLRLPKLGGVEAILEIRRDFPDCRVIVLTTYDTDEDIFRALQAGAKSYLLKDMSQDEIVTAVRNVFAGREILPLLVADTLAKRLTRKDLTDRELAVLKCIVRGRSNKEISTDLDISERTVKFHLVGIFEKLNVLDRTQAAIEAVRHGLVQID
ncbi:MAG: response regulator transcription factor [Verrucomicrobia bacterium]|nr:response regulator transcription factor [Verrucomicrobiota bacterium]